MRRVRGVEKSLFMSSNQQINIKGSFGRGPGRTPPQYDPECAMNRMNHEMCAIILIYVLEASKTVERIDCAKKVEGGTTICSTAPPTHLQYSLAFCSDP